MTFDLARDQLKAIVERVERLELEIKDLNADKSDIYKEARANGFDVKAIKQVVSQRKLDTNEREEADLVFETYWNAVHGINPVHAHARENIEEFDRETGEFLEDGEAVGVASDLPTNFPSDDDAIAAVKGKARLANVADVEPSSSAPIAPASQGEAEAPSVESEEPGILAEDTRSDANTGGDHVTAVETANIHQAGSGLVRTPRPAAHPVLAIRPHCQHPGEEICGGSGRNHCRKCTAAQQEGAPA